MRTIAFTLTCLLAIALCGPAPASAQEQPLGDGARAVHRTWEIRGPGVYELTFNRRADGDPAIVITGNDVTLDLAGLSLLGPGGRQGVGVLVLDASNVEIRNGHLQDFGIGVQAVNSRNVTIEGLQIDGQDSGGSPPDVEIGVMLVDTRGSRVTGNVITNTFLGIFVRGEESGGNRIAGNLITGGVNGELAICYNPAPGASDGGPDGDLVYDNVVSHFRRALSLSADSTGNVVRNNTLAYFDLGIIEATPGSNVIDANDEVQIAR